MSLGGEERLDLLRYLAVHPGRLPSAVRILSAGACASACRRLRSVRRELSGWHPCAGDARPEGLALEVLPRPGASLGPGALPEKVRLAGSDLELQKELDWGQGFSDPEDCFALNRFGWLLALCVERPSRELSEKALSWIEDWILKMGEKRSHPAWESYSVAERLSNWPFVLRIVEGSSPIPAKVGRRVARSMFLQLEHLLQRLEENGAYTSNHILNDARGLYIGGLAMGHETAVRKAKNIFYAWSDRLIGADGLLKEHSSHYQHLICQRWEQVCAVSEIEGDARFHGFMAQRLGPVQRAREFFGVRDGSGRYEMPMIGDVSPDYPADWLKPAPVTGLAKLNGSGPRGSGAAEPGPRQSGSEVIGGEFIRYDGDGITVFWRVPAGAESALFHGHYDVGGFVLFRGAEEIFTDPGRFSYQPAESYGRSARAHSTLTIDDRGAYCEDWRLSSLYRPSDQSAFYGVSGSGGEFHLAINVSGFIRLPARVRWQREFVVKGRRMEIVDTVESEKGSRVAARFQVSPGASVRMDKGMIVIGTKSSGPVRLAVKDDIPFDAGLVDGGGIAADECWCSREYGRRERSAAVLIKRELRGRQVYRYEVSW
jgi:hypothetical protein